MGWGNGQVEYGAAPIYGGGVLYEDTRAIEALQRSNDELVRFSKDLLISRRAWSIVAHYLGKTGKKVSDEEMENLRKQAVTLSESQYKKEGPQKFRKNFITYDLKL